jgi:hypothetical protein
MRRSARSFLLGVLIIAATICLVLGLTLPIIRLTRLYIWSDVHSLASVARELYFSGEIILATVVCLFSIIFPFLKLLYLLALYSIQQVQPNRSAEWLKRLSWLGKWSMLDVLVLALVIFYAKATNLADATSMPGIYLFASAVILTMIATAMIEQDMERQRLPDTDKAEANHAEPAFDTSRLPLHPLLNGQKVKVTPSLIEKAFNQMFVPDACENRCPLFGPMHVSFTHRICPKTGAHFSVRCLSRIKLDYQIRLHPDRIRNIGKLRNARKGRSHFGVIRIDVIGNITFIALHRFEHKNHLA